MKFVLHCLIAASQVSDAQSLQVLNPYLVVPVHVQSREERVYVFFRGVEGRIEYSVSISEHGQSFYSIKRSRSVVIVVGEEIPSYLFGTLDIGES